MFLSAPNIYCEFSQVLKTSTNFRIILNEEVKVLDLYECPKYILWLLTSTRYFKSFRSILNEVVDHQNLSECPKYSCDFLQVVITPTSFKIIIKEFIEILNLSECPKYFLWLLTSCKKF